jgi:hypothetical protein
MTSPGAESVATLAQKLSLGGLLEELRRSFGGYEIVDHWQQGEFHHDLVLAVDRPAPALPGRILVVATNCNGGIKEVLCFGEPPGRSALWHERCPDSPEFSGRLPPLLAAARTVHWFPPAELLGPHARSEYKAEFRERQPGGGWQPRGCALPRKT